jgi:hypothetical protein
VTTSASMGMLVQTRLVHGETLNIVDSMVYLRLLAFLIICVLCAACNHGSTFAIHPPSNATFLRDPASVPIILVGQILSNSKVGGLRKWRPDQDSVSDYQVQMFRVNVRVENTLKGDSLPGDIGIYYFAFHGNVSGPPGLGMAGVSGTWHLGDRELFFLRKESGELRTACDLSARCVPPVFSGNHADFRVDPSISLADSIVDLLLTRGRGCTDQQMIEAVSSYAPSFFSRDYAVAKLRQIVQREVPSVSEAACERLKREHESCVR